MAYTIIPVPPSTPEVYFTCQINGSPFYFHVLWNDRDSSFYMDVMQTDGTPIISGVRMVLHAFLGRTANQPPVVAGVFMCIDTSGQYREAGIDDLGSRVQLVWISQIDLMVSLRSYPS